MRCRAWEEWEGSGGRNNGGSYGRGAKEKKKKRRKKKKKGGKQWKNTSSGPLAALPGPSPPQDYCTKKCYFCFNNLLRHWHSSAGLVFVLQPGTKGSLFLHGQGAGRGPPAPPPPAAAPLPAGAPGLGPGGSRPAPCQQDGGRCQRPPTEPRPRAGGWVAAAGSRAVLATSAGSEGGEGAGARPGVAPAPGAPLKRGLPIERQPGPRGRGAGCQPRPLAAALPFLRGGRERPPGTPCAPVADVGCGLTRGPPASPGAGGAGGAAMARGGGGAPGRGPVPGAAGRRGLRGAHGGAAGRHCHGFGVPTPGAAGCRC